MMVFSCGLTFLIFVLAVKSSSSLICYQCDGIVIIAMNLTTPPGCVKMDDIRITVGSETSHQAYGYNGNFVLLGLTMRSNGSYEYGFTYHCLTDGCNEPKLSKLQLLLDSTTIEHDIDKILPLLYTATPEAALICSRYTNFTDPNRCYSEEINILCLTCLSSIDGITNSLCEKCLENAEIISNLLLDERAYLLKTSNHNFVVHCNIQECNRMDKIEQIRKLYRYDFDYDKFFGRSRSALLFYNKNIIYFFVIILLIWNTL
ncbi:unnamed protein product [Rotaria sp. Silwood1]|nr:unnamed protein product [Rotaria sp. Silwood1]CAF1646562.1 unnamed protein product [Rotaria sp. Silwood1]CAF3775155.1 unnamed protein product [Rotaria sp. Silwood1]